MMKQKCLAGFLPTTVSSHLGGGNSNIFGNLTPMSGEMIQFDEHIFENGLKPPTRVSRVSLKTVAHDVVVEGTDIWVLIDAKT